jgi:hypothetical protein
VLLPPPPLLLLLRLQLLLRLLRLPLLGLPWHGGLVAAPAAAMGSKPA